MAVAGRGADDDPNFELLFQRVNKESAAEGYTRLIKNYSSQGITLKCYSTTAGTEQTNRSVLISMSIGGETDTVESREFDYDEDYEDEEEY